MFDVAARVLLALPFLADGVVRLLRAGRAIEVLSGAGLSSPAAVNYLSAAIQLVGGALLIIGVRIPIAAAVLIVYLLPLSFLLNVVPSHEHPSWALNAIRDLGLAGGLLLLAVVHGRRPRSLRRAGEPLGEAAKTTGGAPAGASPAGETGAPR